MDINVLIENTAKDLGYILTNYNSIRKIYIFRDKNITDTVQIKVDKVEMYYFANGEYATKAWLKKLFDKVGL